MSEHGEEHLFRSRETEIEELVRFAWEDRVVITVFSDHRESGRPVRIVLRRALLRR